MRDRDLSLREVVRLLGKVGDGASCALEKSGQALHS